MRTTNIFSAGLIAIAVVQGAPLHRTISPTLSNNQALKHASNLDSAAPDIPIDLTEESGDRSHLLLVTRAKLPFKSDAPKISVPKLSYSKPKSAKPKSSKPKSSKPKSSKPKSSKPKSSKPKSSKPKSSKPKSSNGESSKSTGDKGSNSEQYPPKPSSNDTANSPEADTEQDSQDLSDKKTEQGSIHLFEHNREGVINNFSDDNEIESWEDDPDDPNLGQEVPVKNLEKAKQTIGEDGFEVDAATNITLRLARTIRHDREYKRSTLLFHDGYQQNNQGTKDSDRAESGMAADADAFPEANREGDKEQSMGRFSEKRGLKGLSGLFKAFAKVFAEQGVEEAASFADNEDGNAIALPEMAKRRVNANYEM